MVPPHSKKDPSACSVGAQRPVEQRNSLGLGQIERQSGPSSMAQWHCGLTSIVTSVALGQKLNLSSFSCKNIFCPLQGVMVKSR